MRTRKRITVELSEKELENIQMFLQSTAYAGEIAPQLTLSTLVGMLLQDVALTMSRPGSWEGSNMIQVLRGHGYDS